jgi:hypothetical protein
MYRFMTKMKTGKEQMKILRDGRLQTLTSLPDFQSGVYLSDKWRQDRETVLLDNLLHSFLFAKILPQLLYTRA